MLGKPFPGTWRHFLYLLTPHSSFLLGFGLSIACEYHVSRDTLLLLTAVTLNIANAAPMLVTEVSYPVYRPQLSSLYNTLWYSGNIVYVILSDRVSQRAHTVSITVLHGPRSERRVSTATGHGVSPPSSRPFPPSYSSSSSGSSPSRPVSSSARARRPRPCTHSRTTMPTVTTLIHSCCTSSRRLRRPSSSIKRVSPLSGDSLPCKLS